MSRRIPRDHTASHVHRNPPPETGPPVDPGPYRTLGPAPRDSGLPEQVPVQTLDGEPRGVPGNVASYWKARALRAEKVALEERRKRWDAERKSLEGLMRHWFTPTPSPDPWTPERGETHE